MTKNRSPWTDEQGIWRKPVVTTCPSPHYNPYEGGDESATISPKKSYYEYVSPGRTPGSIRDSSMFVDSAERPVRRALVHELNESSGTSPFRQPGQTISSQIGSQIPPQSPSRQGVYSSRVMESSTPQRSSQAGETDNAPSSAVSARVQQLLSGDDRVPLSSGAIQLLSPHPIPRAYIPESPVRLSVQVPPSQSVLQQQPQTPVARTPSSTPHVPRTPTALTEPTPRVLSSPGRIPVEVTNLYTPSRVPPQSPVSVIQTPKGTMLASTGKRGPAAFNTGGETADIVPHRPSYEEGILLKRTLQYKSTG